MVNFNPSITIVSRLTSPGAGRRAEQLFQPLDDDDASSGARRQAARVAARVARVRGSGGLT
jgi:hypothetical protein